MLSYARPHVSVILQLIMDLFLDRSLPLKKTFNKLLMFCTYKGMQKNLQNKAKQLKKEKTQRGSSVDEDGYKI